MSEYAQKENIDEWEIKGQVEYECNRHTASHYS